MSEATEELRIYCREHEVRRFSADEVLELLEDGETVDWIMDQILPASTPDSAAQLRGVLERLAEESGIEPLIGPAGSVAFVEVTSIGV